MQKLIVGMLLAGVFIGAMMPSTPRAVPQSSATIAEGGARTGYSNDEDSPSANVDLGSGVITLDRSSDGHFYADVQVNGMPINFMIDTGASSIALTREDAQRAGVALSPGMDEVVGSGASGDVKGQFVTLDRVNLGIKEVRGAQAAVLYGGDQSLLGQSFLSQFGSVAIEGDKMILR
jgi:aspartyl protease family protein